MIEPKSSVEITPLKQFLGLLNKRERWGLSLRGWLVVLLVVLSSVFYVIAVVQPFLAVTQRVEARFLVVEGWVREYAIQAAVQEFFTGSYERVFATGGPSKGSGGYVSDADTSASVTAGQLRRAGIPPESLQMVPSQVIGRDRTYHSAVALREWFKKHHGEVRSINVLTESAHARRTWLLFQQAFGDGFNVGIISVRNPDYNSGHWWRSSDGFRDVVGELIAYLYAKLHFRSFEASGPHRGGSSHEISQGCSSVRCNCGTPCATA